MGCSKRVTKKDLWGQLYLAELRRDHLGWSTTHHQEWGLFLLDHMLHNAAAMWKSVKEPQEGAPMLKELRWLK